ncbi:MAG: hypothetical protein JWN98_55 [Abditibacteriota bacterium]|nr:hypothetical protein [Abditibacteriota bacterium]
MKRIFSVALAAVCLAHAPEARSQNTTVATVTAVQRVAELREGAAPWKRRGRGAALRLGDGFRTGKRSKADLKFTDGSLLRLGQLSSVEVREAKSVALLSGQVLFSALRPGRVLAGSGVAEIKGSVGIVTMMEDGTAEFSLFSGAVEVSTAIARVDLPPGFWVRARPDGTLSEVQPAPPLRFSFGAFMPEINQEIAEGPFVGSQRNRRLRLTPERTALDVYNPNIEVRDSLPFRRSVPAPSPRPGSQLFSISDAGLPSHPKPGRLTERLKEAIFESGAVDARAFDHLREADPELGHFSGFDYAVLGAVSDDESYATGARLRGFGTRGRFYGELGALPLRVYARGRNRRNNPHYSAINLASLTYRTDDYDVQLGRQRFVSGPTQLTLFGSLLRPGGREVMDAIRLEPNLGKGRTLEIAYLQDAFVRNLPYRVGGDQRGVAARAAMETPGANLGLNMLRYIHLPGDDNVGATLDFAVPLVRNEIEFYGEAGRDPFRRTMLSMGAFFPGVHDRTGIDLFIEYARVNSHAGVPGVPTEVAARAYKRLNRHTYIVLGANRFKRAASSVTLGLSIGGRSYHGDAP